MFVHTTEKKDLVEDCINSLLKLNYPKDKYEIIFVDDGSTDGTYEILNKYPIKVIHNKRNLGLYASKNIGIRKSKGEIIAVTDDDCVVDKNWLKNIILTYDEDAKIGSVGGVVLPYKPKTLVEKFAISQKILSQPKDCSFLLVQIVPTEKDVLEKVSYFDESFISGGDVDISYRIKDNGFKLKLASNAKVFHKHRISISGLFRQYEKYGMGMFIY
ncbi:hypothetical protein DRN73_07765 [Candidatus Pacearchaeota archaeon]|nr:MAG: hypothetical protein DRN73_07765 [Candidatus Pacearchaeota archaeon]